MLQTTVTRNIEFGDVDLTGAMWHGAYARYYEHARCKLLEDLGISYQTILCNGFQIPVVSLKIKFIRPCHFNQKILISAKIEPSEHMLIIKYEIRDFETKEKLSSAETKHMAFSNDIQKALYQLPNFILSKIGNYNNEQ